MNKAVQGLKTETESVKKTQTKGIMEMRKNIRIWIRTKEPNFTNRIQEMDQRILGLEDIIEEINQLKS